MRKLKIGGCVVGIMGLMFCSRSWIVNLFSDMFLGKKRVKDVHRGWHKRRQYEWTGSWLNRFTARPRMRGERFAEES